MKKLLMVVAMLGVVGASLVSGETDETHAFFGEIADSQCALNVHSLTRSHKEMLKSKSMGGTSASCVAYCIKYLGGDFVLATKKDVYRLDNQEKAGKFVGEKVKVTGDLEGKKGTIHVVSIERDDRALAAESGN
jgi:Protein of unknown function (DUF5818)